MTRRYPTERRTATTQVPSRFPLRSDPSAFALLPAAQAERSGPSIRFGLLRYTPSVAYVRTYGHTLCRTSTSATSSVSSPLLSSFSSFHRLLKPYASFGTQEIQRDFSSTRTLRHVCERERERDMISYFVKYTYNFKVYNAVLSTTETCGCGF